MPSTTRAAWSSAAAAPCTTRCRDWTMREMDNTSSDATKNRWNASHGSNEKPDPGLWTIELHIGHDGVGAKWEEMLVVTNC